MDNDKNDDIDRRMVINFPTLKEKQEKAILDHIMYFIIYYSKITNIEKQPDASSVYNYYCRNIMKPKSVEILLDDVNVKIDLVKYIEKYYDPIVNIVPDDSFPMIIDLSKAYNRELYIRVMKDLLERFGDKKEVVEIIEYLKEHGLNYTNLSDEYIKRIIKKVYDVC